MALRLVLALFVLLVITRLSNGARASSRNVAVLLGIVVGCVLASVLGQDALRQGRVRRHGSASSIRSSSACRKFDLVPIVTMCMVMIVVMIESTGMFLALGEMTGKKIDQRRLTSGLRADGVGTMIGGIFNTFPYTSFSQNVGLVGVTGVRSRWVTRRRRRDHAGRSACCRRWRRWSSRCRWSCWAAPGIVMFGMVAATGVAHPRRRRLQDQPPQPVRRRDLGRLRHDPAGGAELLQASCRTELHPLLESGILLAAIVAVVLNSSSTASPARRRGEARRRGQPPSTSAASQPIAIGRFRSWHSSAIHMARAASA